MKLYVSFFAMAVSSIASISITTAKPLDNTINKSGLRHLADSSSAPSSSPGVSIDDHFDDDYKNDDSEEVCFPFHRNATKPEAALFHSLAVGTVDESFRGVTAPPGQATPNYALGCGFLDFKCYSCELCLDMYGKLVDTGSEQGCNAACAGIAEITGGGPLDPIAGMVSAACTPLCKEIFSAVGGAAHDVCSAVHLC